VPARAAEPAAPKVDDVGGDLQVQQTLLEHRWYR